MFFVKKKLILLLSKDTLIWIKKVDKKILKKMMNEQKH